MSSSAGGKVDAFALMRAAAKSSKQKPAAADPDENLDGDDGDGDAALAETSKGKGKGKQPSTAAPVFKGSGLGAGPRHFVDPGASLPALAVAERTAAETHFRLHVRGYYTFTHSEPTLGREIVRAAEVTWLGDDPLCSPNLPLHSRPKNLGEVSAQDHTVQVLTKTLTSSNVCYSFEPQVSNSRRRN